MTDIELIELLMQNAKMTNDEFLRFCLHYRTRDVATVVEYIRFYANKTTINKTLPDVLRSAMNSFIRQYSPECAVW